LEIYYNQGQVNKNGKTFCVRDLIRKRLADVLDQHKDDEIFLIAHSMGTIVAYDVLVLQLTHSEIDTFATIGSPLGIPTVISKIAAEYKKIFNDSLKPSTPASVKRYWYNFSDVEDKVAMNYNLADDYEANESGIKAIDFTVNNNYIMNGVKNPHKSFGYLRTPEFSKALFEFLIQDRMKITIWLLNLLNKIYGWAIKKTIKYLRKFYTVLTGVEYEP
jgi:pimeloyl-ACP methyl ester carboxylesterase